MPSISDDDLCSGCTKCTYKPGASSSCEHDFPGSPDQDGYIVRCAEFRPQPITMTPEQVQAAIAGLDLKTYKGWIAGAIALLKDKPVGTAIEDQGGYLALIDGGLCCLAGFSDGRTTYEMEDGHPVDGGEPDVSAWDDERCCWDGLESAEQNALTLTAPVFVTLTFVEISASPVAMSAEVAAHEAGEDAPSTTAPKTQAELVRAAVLAKIAHWDALCALERSYASELTDNQNDAMCESVEMLAASVENESAISDEAAQAVLDAIAKA